MSTARKVPWARRIAHVATLSLLVFAVATVAQAVFAPNDLPRAHAVTNTGSCDGKGSASLKDTHPGKGLHLGHETGVAFVGDGKTGLCNSNTNIGVVEGSGTSTLDGTCMNAVGKAFAETKSSTADGKFLGRSKGSADIVTTATANNVLKATVTYFQIDDGFMKGAFGAGEALTAEGFLDSCALGGQVTGGTADGRGNANR